MAPRFGYGVRLVNTAALRALIIYAVILPLAVFIGWNKALAGGLWPFLIGDAIKLVLAALIMPSAWMLVKSMERGGKA